MIELTKSSKKAAKLSVYNKKTEALEQELKVKRNSKDSVFKCLFGNKEYLLGLYKEFHPEDKNVTCDDLQNVTIDSPITYRMCNDLGFTVRDKLIILAEAQSTWTVNICFRMFLYLAETYKKYAERKKLDLYHKKAKIPKPELYVIYTGVISVPEEISLNKEFFGGAAPIDVRVKVINKENASTLTGQYIIFSRTFDKQRKLCKNNVAAMKKTIDFCIENGILVKFVSDYKGDLCKMVSVLHDDDFLISVMREKYEAKGRALGKKEGKAEGRAKGKAEGRAEGKAEGRAERENEIVNRLLSQGFSKKKIKEMLG